jgi:hypothetical protein
MVDFAIPSTLFTGGDATSYDLPNYVDELFMLMPQLTPVLSAIGGENGGRSVQSRDFTWQVIDGEPASSTNQRLENATVTGDLVQRQSVSNVVEIHQEAVEMGYTAQSVENQVGPLAPETTYGVVLGDNPVSDPMQLQINLKIGKIKRDLETTFINGTYNNAGVGTARRTRGLLEAVVEHAINYTTGAGGKGTAYTTIRSVIDDILIEMAAPADEAATAPFIMPVFVVNPHTRTVISSEYTNSGALAPRDRTIGGVAIDTIVTDFGTFGLMSDRYIAKTNMLVLDLSVLRPVLLPIKNHGHFFVEPLGKTGATDAIQIYGEIGLEYGPETYHGKVTAITL